MNEPIPLARPLLGTGELDALARVIASRRLSGGSELEAFEASMAKLAGTAGAAGVNSGTMGLQLALEALGIGPGDEVITVSFTFIGTVNAIVNAGADAVLVDIDPATVNLDPGALEDAVSPRTRGVLAVHLFGRPAPMDEILAFARRHRLVVIEDACEATGSRYQGRPVGGLADAGVFGFYPNKALTTGEGGMIVSNDTGFLDRCRRLRNQGLDPLSGHREESRAGYSARLSELHAALGNVQLARLEDNLARREVVAARYTELLTGKRAVDIPATVAPGDRIAWFTYPVRIACGLSRNTLIAAMHERGIECAPYFEPVHRLPFHRDRQRCLPLPVTEEAGRRYVGLPLFPEMTAAQVERVCAALIDALHG